MHVALIVSRDGRIVGAGVNHDHVHAEVEALRSLRTCRHHRVYSLRFTRSGKLASAKPCRVCRAELRNYGVALVTYSTQEGTLITEDV